MQLLITGCSIQLPGVESMRAVKNLIFAAAIGMLLCGAAFAQAAGTCAGMSVGQLTSLNGFVPFQATSSLWTTDISAAPVDPNSASIINFIGSSVTLHPDFGSGTYSNQTIGIPYQVVAGSQAKVPIIFGLYAD